MNGREARQLTEWESARLAAPSERSAQTSRAQYAYETFVGGRTIITVELPDP